MKDYFEVLDIDENAGEQAIRDAYETMLEKYPADRFPEKNMEIEEAFKALSNRALKSACIEFHRMEAASKKAYEEARDAIGEGKYSKAARVLEKACKNAKYSPHLNYLLGITYMNMDKPARAAKVLEPVMCDYPYDMELVILFIRACLAAKKYDKALALAEEYYAENKDDFDLVQLLAEGYILAEKYNEATKVLVEAFENEAFSKKRFSIGAGLSYSLFMEKKFKKSLDMIGKLAEFSVRPDEADESLEIFINMLDFYIARQEFREADRYADALLKLYPDREDIAGIKEGIELILKLEPELAEFENDKFIPDLLKVYATNDAIPSNIDETDEERKKAYEVLLEYQILNDYSDCLMALRYMKNNYPALYDIKRDFFDGLQDARERKKLYNKNKALFYQYHGIIEDMMDEWDEEDDGDHDDDE
jgi:tetratricopeptide (TPR) repeat protein